MAAHVNEIDRVVILGPSHAYPLNDIGITTYDEWATPMGNIKVDKQAVHDLESGAKAVKGINIQELTNKVELAEHGLEFHTPFIYKVFKDAGRVDALKIVPLMVGGLPEDTYDKYAKLLLPFFKDERTTFAISSDFCHWGESFAYKPVFPDEPIVWKGIERLDRIGMQAIES